MNINEFDFNLPKELIAQKPILNREESKLLVVNRETKKVEHKIFKDIVNYLDKGDCLVLNNTKVIPARLIGKKKDTNSEVEILLLNKKFYNIWETLVHPGKKARVGDTIVFGNELVAHVEEILEDGNRIIRFEFDDLFEEILDRLGEMPLPHYISEKLHDKNRYQTVYAKNDGSVAAPTAGLHFTKELLQEIEEKNIKIANITLHVGLGTFKPVKTDNILEHKMHKEYYKILQRDADIINESKKNGNKVIAVGTTSCRTIESIADDKGFLKESEGYTDIFIYPGYKFKVTDRLITNFHLPKSTLMMLVSAFYNKQEILKVYDTAIKEKYRFFSFGDAMLIK